MWTFLLDPVMQGLFFLIAVAALCYVTWDLYDEARDPSPSSVFARRAAPRAEAPRARVEAGEAASVKTWRDLEGDVRGRVLRGPCRNMSFDDMTREDCEAQTAYARGNDPDSVAALEAYIRQRFGPKRRPEPPRREGAMTRGDALSELGLRDGASEAEIHSAWRAMIKKHHPDHGGSHARAARINAAKAALEG